MKKALIIGVSFLLPIVTFAQLSTVETNIVRPIGRIVSLLIPIVFALALLYFFWGLATYILSAEHDKEIAKKRMLWGVVALFVMAAVWGLVRFLQTTLGIDNTTTVPNPSFTPQVPSI